MITPVCEIMTEEEFTRHAMRIMKLFKPDQPPEEYVEIDTADLEPHDAETVAQMFALFLCEPEGSA